MSSYQPKPPKTRTLSPKQIAVLGALLSGATNEEAARLANCSLATVERYKADPNFREQMANLASETLLLVSENMIRAALKAVRVFEEIVEDKSVRPADRLKAGQLILENLDKARALGYSISDRVGIGLEVAPPQPEIEVLHSESSREYLTPEESRGFINSFRRSL